MKLKTIASSSSGNCTRVSSGKTSILIDCGIPRKRVYEDGVFDISAIFITHEHSDHIKGVNVLYKKAKCKVYLHRHVYEARPKHFESIPIEDIMFIEAGDITTIDDTFTVEGFSTKHDAAYSMGFVVTEISSSKRFGYMTDTGAVTALIKNKLKECDSYFIEADYDDEQLKKYADYSIELKDRIKGNFGHLSTAQAIEFIKESVDLEKVNNVIFGHLSARTNSPELVQASIDEEFPKYINKFYIAPIDEELDI
ncbi:MBL fold metallo-hydrolase [Candidatus Peregrinibacteria bacterium]|jgi:phosphoribosyl 1,2-cyclic phosphodiesterase|nr:MBL fold metallo-hydrolase [Candidatus Peregrinibacteria bacterium]